MRANEKTAAAAGCSALTAGDRPGLPAPSYLFSPRDDGGGPDGGVIGAGADGLAAGLGGGEREREDGLLGRRAFFFLFVQG